MKNKSKLIYGCLMLGLAVSIPCISQLTIKQQPKFAEIEPTIEMELITVEEQGILSMEQLTKETLGAAKMTTEASTEVIMGTTATTATEASTEIIAGSTATTATVTEAPTTEATMEQVSPQYSDLKYLAAIVYCESGNQCMAGQQAVAIVVMNRVRSDSFPNDIYSVLYQSGQFTPASNGSLNKGLSMYDNGTLPQSCIDAANYALAGNTFVTYNDETRDISDYYFFGRYRNNCRWQIQDHQFE